MMRKMQKDGALLSQDYFAWIGDHQLWRVSHGFVVQAA